MANGKTYIFNCYHEEVGININGIDAKPVPGWSFDEFPPIFSKYTPASGSFPIVSENPGPPDTSLFVYDKPNVLALSWIENAAFPHITFNMPGMQDGVKIEDDVIIYVSRNAVIVLRNDGTIIGDLHSFPPPQ